MQTSIQVPGEQLSNGDPTLSPPMRNKYIIPTEGKYTLTVSVTTVGGGVFGESGPGDGWRTPPPKPPKVHKQVMTSNSNLEHSGHVQPTILKDLEFMEAEPKGQKVEEVRVR